MKLKLFLAATLLVAVSPLYSQSVIGYYDIDGNTTEKENCYSYTITKEKYNVVDTIKSFYCASDRVKRIVQVDAEGRYHGRYVTYFPNGSLQHRALFHEYTQVDTFQVWYADGRKKLEEYRGTSEKQDYSLLNYWDSTGIQLVKNGQGHCRCVFSNPWGDFDEIAVGKISDGKKDSVWTIYQKQGRKYTEHYDHGTFVRGMTLDDEGNEKEYFVIEDAAKPQGGMAKFYAFVGSNIKYPKSARKQGVEGKVYVEFMIEKDGAITGVRTIRGIGGGCDEAAEDVIRHSPKWIPGTQRGQPVRQKMVLPINFAIR